MALSDPRSVQSAHASISEHAKWNAASPSGVPYARPGLSFSSSASDRAMSPLALHARGGKSLADGFHGASVFAVSACVIASARRPSRSCSRPDEVGEPQVFVELEHPSQFAGCLVGTPGR